MGVRILTGKLGGGSVDAAVLYDSTTDWPVGPIWQGDEAEEQAEAFLDWVSSGRWLNHKAEVDAEDPHMRVKIVLGGDDSDLRSFTSRAIVCMIAVWRKLYLDSDGYLLDTKECVCGEGHHHDDEGCYYSGCGCTTFVPANPAGVLEASYG